MIASTSESRCQHACYAEHPRTSRGASYSRRIAPPCCRSRRRAANGCEILAGRAGSVDLCRSHPPCDRGARVRKPSRDTMKRHSPGGLDRCRRTPRLRLDCLPKPAWAKAALASHPLTTGRLSPDDGSITPRWWVDYPLRTCSISTLAAPKRHRSVRRRRAHCWTLRACNEFEPVASRTTGTPPAGDTSTAGSSSSRARSLVWVTASWETRVAPGGSGVKAAQRTRGRSPLCANVGREARPSLSGPRSGPSLLDTYGVTRPVRGQCARGTL